MADPAAAPPFLLSAMDKRGCRGMIGSQQREREDQAMTQSELYAKGAAMRRELYGEAAADRSARDIYTDPMMKKFLDVATENVFGALWTRPGLDLKTRTMICVASDVATGREPELAIHLRFALRQGWTEDELTEAMLHLTGYIGLPLVRGAMLVAKRVFAEIRAEQGK
jgi:4-carboxymuconolactone decarboxylase